MWSVWKRSPKFAHSITSEWDKLILSLTSKWHTPTTNKWPKLVFFFKKDGLIFSTDRPLSSSYRPRWVESKSSPHTLLCILLSHVGRVGEMRRQSHHNRRLGKSKSGVALIVGYHRHWHWALYLAPINVTVQYWLDAISIVVFFASQRRNVCSWPCWHGGTANSTNDDNMQDDPLYACRGQTNKRQPSTDDGL
jgi:hypothetical protein